MNTNTNLESSIFPIACGELWGNVNAYLDYPDAQISPDDWYEHLMTVLGTSMELYLEPTTDPLTGKEVMHLALPKEVAVVVAGAFSIEAASELAECD